MTDTPMFHLKADYAPAGDQPGAIATLVDGFELIADETGLFDAIEGADLVVTGEGHLDAESFNGKVVGGVVAAAVDAGAACLVIVGSIDETLEPTWPTGVEVVDLTERFGAERARTETVELVAQLVAERLGPTIAP